MFSWKTNGHIRADSIHILEIRLQKKLMMVEIVSVMVLETAFISTVETVKYVFIRSGNRFRSSEIRTKEIRSKNDNR